MTSHDHNLLEQEERVESIGSLDGFRAWCKDRQLGLQVMLVDRYRSDVKDTERAAVSPPTKPS